MAFGWLGSQAVLYYVNSSTGRVGMISTTAPTAPTASNLRFVSVTPQRVYDTRNDIGIATGPVMGGTSRVVDVDTASTPPGTTAALVNITFTDATGPGYGQAWQTRTVRPDTSIINVVQPGETVANSAIVSLDANGTFMIGATATTHVLVDVMGYFTTSGGGSSGRFVPVGPTRLIDTRAAANATTNPYSVVGDHLDVQVLGRAGVPASGVGALVFTITALGGTDAIPGFATAYPQGVTRPVASNVNTLGGIADIRANLAMVPLGGGQLSVYLERVDDALIDVVGYITDTSVPGGTGSLYQAIAPQRVVDTRQPIGFGSLAAGGSATAVLTPPLPASATGVVHNLTVTNTAGWGYLTAAPAGAAVPVVSNANYVGPLQTRAALAVTPLPASGAVQFYSSNGTDLIVDVVGYFG
jgi:hypothetical protein